MMGRFLSREVASVTVKRRLFLSNILMILVPVCISALIAAGCAGAIWYTVVHDVGLGFEDSESFYHASSVISKIIEEHLKSGAKGLSRERREKLESMSRLLDQKAMSLTILRDGAPYYAYGASDDADASLIAGASAMQGEGILTRDGRSLCARAVKKGETLYQVYLFSRRGELSYKTLKRAVALALGVLSLAVLLSVLLTNRFLTKFVLQRIEQPLDILSGGVRQIRDGNLDYRIAYSGRDEFTPVCSDFNEMAQRLKDSVERTRRHEESRRELMAGISHDLRSPLTSVQAYVEGLLDGVAKTPETRRKYLGTIKNKAENIQRMVSQIFLFSKMELEEYPIRMETLRLDREIENLLKDLRGEYAARGLSIEARLCPATVKADAAEIRRVLVNIWDNSAKYKAKPLGRMEILLEAKDESCVLSLTDDGPGVPREALNRLFEVFYRSDPSRQNPHRGSGLGLAIAAKALQRMGGTIWAEEAETGGLRILIELPLEAENA